MSLFLRRVGAGALTAVLSLPVATPLAAQTSEPPRVDLGSGAAPDPITGPAIEIGPPPEAQIKGVLDRVRDFLDRSATRRIVDQETGQEITDFSTPTLTAVIDPKGRLFTDWNYEIGVAYSGLVRATEVTGDSSYLDLALEDLDFLFSHLDYFRRSWEKRAELPGFKQDRDFRASTFRRMIRPGSLDDCGSMTAALIKAYGKKKDERYLPVIREADEQISKRQHRLADGTLARRGPESDTLWLDDLYMSVPALAQLGQMTGERRYLDDGARQILQMADRMFDPSKLYWDHNWYTTVQYDPKFYWSRANGWAAMATVELLSVMPEDHPQRAKLIDLLKRFATGLTQAQSGTGLWHQLLDKSDSYLETSGSAMFVYAIARGVNRGWLEPTYASVAVTGWNAVARRVTPEGDVDGTCVGTNAAFDNVYYYNRPVLLRPGSAQPTRPMHGYGPVLLAGAEVLQLTRQFDRNAGPLRYTPKVPAGAK